MVNRKFVGGREREWRNGGKSVDSKDESGERLANKSWQAAADTADTTSGKNRCSVTEEARREKETRYIQWASCELFAKNSFLFPFLLLFRSKLLFRNELINNSMMRIERYTNNIQYRVIEHASVIDLQTVEEIFVSRSPRIVYPSFLFVIG